ncbi:unnamed protein product (plasmid) [Mycetohabitans rhizoxinica HKI 454]|uniref:Uncharacterized protein n=1 Tax=Mycetohabitans rhizoxinica (strain DSM 19002 / CIP 109453 / HKI 454) TaxID=882378 RepID=E5AUG0_MYCRK|nr:unnamed protein product [Mycetohabitans rhizoxinica HKI 454]
MIARIGDYVPVQDMMSFSTVDRRTYHAMQTRRLVHRYWRRANRPRVVNQSTSCSMKWAARSPIQRSMPNPWKFSAPAQARIQSSKVCPINCGISAG